MLKKQRQYYLGLISSFLVFTLLVSLFDFSDVLAGIYDSSQEVTYKEYWVPHSEFTGGIQHDPSNEYLAKPGCPTNTGNGSWYLEPWPHQDINGVPCVKELELNIPENFSQALRAEIYLDLWRNHASQQAWFQINDGQQRHPNVGLDWSRTPYVGEIPLSELKTGTNTLKFWSTGGGYHIHDIAIRIYFDDAHPLLSAGGSPISAPTGGLIDITDDNGAKAVNAGGDLWVTGNQLVLRAETTSAAKLIEFHAYYEGYDEDNDGEFRDWHNLGRNSWFPGGTEAKTQGGTINHIRTVMAPSAGQYSATWNLGHVSNQSGVKFKVRIVDNDYVVREAAGGSSASFALKRNRSVLAFYNSEFRDNVLHHNQDQSEPAIGFSDTYLTKVDLPVEPSSYGQAYFIGAYWQNPWVILNRKDTLCTTHPSCFRGNAAGQDWWELGIVSRPVSELKAGENDIRYDWAGGFGQFIEKPGPMIVLGQTSNTSDSTPPTATLNRPNSSQNVAIDTAIIVTLSDVASGSGHGVDRTSIKMWVNDQLVTPKISGFASEYVLTYAPPTFEYDTLVTVEVEAGDLAGNQMGRKSYSFRTQVQDLPLDATSDDFNVCTLDTGVWTWVDPQVGGAGESSYRMTGSQFEISVPAGTGHDVWAGGNLAPRLMQSVNNDPNFEVQVKFTSSMDKNYQFQGVIIEQDADNYLRINFQHNGANATLLAAKIVDGTPALIWDRLLSPSDGQAPMYMRIQRDGSDWSIAYSFDGFSWTTDSNFAFNHSMSMDKIGVFAGNAGGNPAFISLVDFFFDMETPISPQNVNVLSLENLDLTLVSDPVSPSGFGEVTGGPVTPTAGNPLCGSPLSLTAAPMDGWEFDQWKVDTDSGLIETSDNPYVREFKNGESIQALFNQSSFALDVNVVNQGVGPGGDVDISPDQAVYYYGDVVTLTTQKGDGWVFDGWSGDLAGINPTAIVTMTETKAVTATFTQLQYTLDVNVAGGGNGIVQVNPDDDTYLHGDEVMLKAISALDGSKFGGWSGDLPGGADPQAETLSLTMNDSKALTATFTLGYAITSTVEGQGVVQFDPPQNEYDAGAVVTVEGVSAVGWRFDHWEGALSDTNDNPATIIMDSNKEVKAVFVPQTYAVSLKVEGEGTISMTPEKEVFGHGDQIVVTAASALGWSFSHWSGDITGTDMSVPMTVTSDIVATAHFEAFDHFIYLPIGKR